MPCASTYINAKCNPTGLSEIDDFVRSVHVMCPTENAIHRDSWDAIVAEHYVRKAGLFVVTTVDSLWDDDGGWRQEGWLVECESHMIVLQTDY